jgi:anti-sigma factor RsiW
MNAAQRATDCKSTRSVDAYADGELEPSRALEIEQHLVACRSCREELELIKAMRQGLRRSVTRTAPVSLADRMRLVAASELEASGQEEAAGRSSMSVAAKAPSSEDKTVRERLKARASWGATITFAAAAGFVLAFFGSRSDTLRQPIAKTASAVDNVTPPTPINTGLFQRRPEGFDAVIERLVAFHANPPPSEVMDVDQAVHRFEPLVGVHMPGTTLRRPLGATFSGARAVDMDVQPTEELHYTAALRYTMQGHRITIYVFNPSVVPIQVTRLRPRMIKVPSGPSPYGSSQTQPLMVANGPPNDGASRPHDVPVYVGRVRGFSVAAAEESGIGYAVASDLDDDKTAQLVANFQ